MSRVDAMTPFQQMWEDSRTNAFSGQTPLVNWIAVLILLAIALLPDRVYLLRWILNVSTIVTAGWITTDYSSLEIEEKWRIRYHYADTHEDELTDDEHYAVCVDGANRLLGPVIFGAIETIRRCGFVLFTILIMRLILKTLRRYVKRRRDWMERHAAEAAADA